MKLEWLSTFLEDGGLPEYSKYMAVIWIRKLFYFDELAFSLTNIKDYTLLCKKSAKFNWKNLIKNSIAYLRIWQNNLFTKKIYDYRKK